MTEGTRAMEAMLGERTRVNLTLVGFASLLLGVGGGVAGAVTTVYAMRDQVLTQARYERERELTAYVTRDELARLREADRDRLDAKMDELRVELRALTIAVARIRR